VVWCGCGGVVVWWCGVVVWWCGGGGVVWCGVVVWWCGGGGMVVWWCGVVPHPLTDPNFASAFCLELSESLHSHCNLVV
jgi:hypothetical protein